MHRNLNDQTVYLCKQGSDENHVKVANYENAVKREGVRGEKMVSGVVGTPGYIAPEVYRGTYAYSADRWSLGCLLHKLLTGHLPCEGKTNDEIKEATLNYKFDMNAKVLKGCSIYAREFLENLL